MRGISKRWSRFNRLVVCTKWLLSMLVGLALFTSGLAAANEPLADWHWRNPKPQGNPLKNLAYGGGQFVAVGAAGAVVTSLDGVNWLSANSGANASLTAVAYGNGVYVAVGDDGTILKSTNGTLWNTSLKQPGRSLYDITWGDGTYVAAGQSNGRGEILVSTNGTDWLEVAFPILRVIQAVGYGGGTFVAAASGVTSANMILLSSDGVHWSMHDSGTNLVVKFAYGSGTFVGKAGDSTVLTSDDGANWTPRNTGSAAHLVNITHAADRFVAVGQSEVLVSSDGIGWEGVPGAGTLQPLLGGLAYGNGLLVGVPGFSETLLSSPDGAQWTAHGSGTHEDFSRIAHGNDIFLALGNNLWKSSNGVDWSVLPITNTAIAAITYGNGQFVAVGLTNDTAVSWVSADGVEWSSHQITNGVRLRDVAYGNGMYMAAGRANGTAQVQTPLFISADGKTWSTEGLAPNLPSQVLSIRFANGRFFYFSRDVLAESPDGRSWTSKNTGREDGYYDFVFDITYGRGRYVAVGAWWANEDDYFTLVLVSTNGITWTRTVADIEDCGYLHTVKFGGGYFVAVGEDGISISEDGMTWRPGYPAVGAELDDVAFGHGTFVSVGKAGSILQSDPIVRLLLQFSGLPKLILSGPANRSYKIEAAEMLNGTWLELTNLVIGSSPASWTDTSGTNSLRRYYRGVLVP